MLLLAASLLPREDWTAAFASQPNEYHRVPLKLTTGTPPASLSGTLYKNGPANFHRGGVEYAHWLDGDGYVTALEIRPGEPAIWSGRYVLTDALEQEQAADSIVYRTTFGTLRPGGVLANAGDIRLKSPANTNVMSLADGTLLALWEAGPPYELDPHTLECKGTHSLDGRMRLSGSHGALPGTTSIPWLDSALESIGLLTDACSAHPREDDYSKQCTIAWSWRQRLVGDPAIDIALHAVPHEEATTTASPSPPPPPVRATLPGVAFAPHDMALTPNYAVFISSPTVVELGQYLIGLRGPAQCTKFIEPPPRGGSTIHLVTRTGEDSGESRAYCIGDGLTYHPVHTANAWEEEEEEEEEVHLLASCWPPEAVRRLARSGSSLLGSWDELVKGDFSKVAMTNLVRFVIDRKTAKVTEHRILAGGAQFDHPRVHPRWATRRSRYVFGTLGRRDNGGENDAVPEPPTRFGCIDVSTASGELVDAWYAGDRRLVDEATLVPIEGEEDDERAVWLIAPVFDGVTRTTSYVVLDGRDLAAGPVCEWACPTFIPWGLHGAWV